MVAFVDAEIIRPRSWILANGLCAGRMLPLNLPELEVSGLALVTAIDDCPPIASSKIISGGCFIEGTIVTVSSLPGRSSPTDSLWSDPSWLDEPSRETPWLAPERYASVDRPRDAVPSFKLEICSIGLGGIVGNEGCTRVKS